MTASNYFSFLFNDSTKNLKLLTALFKKGGLFLTGYSMVASIAFLAASSSVVMAVNVFAHIALYGMAFYIGGLVMESTLKTRDMTQQLNQLNKTQAAIAASEALVDVAQTDEVIKQQEAIAKKA